MAELAPQDAIAALRRPKIVFTDAYKDDPIQFNTDERFIAQTVIAQNENIGVIERDATDFAVVTLNASKPQLYSLDMFSTVYNRVDITRIIDKEFKQLVSNNG
jgi:hypothetical protein